MRNFFLSILLIIPQWALAVTPIVHNIPVGVELQNNLVSIVFSERAELLSCTELMTGKDIATHDKGKIASLKTNDGRTVKAERLILQGDVIKLSIGEYEIKVRVKAFDDYFTWEVINNNLPGVDVLTFLDLKFKYEFKAENVFLATAAAMTLQTNPVYYPSGENKAIQGCCTSRTGIKGAKLAIVACKKSNLRKTLKEIYNTITVDNVPMTRAGGAFALDFEANRHDAVILYGNTDPRVAVENIDFYSQLGIKQVNFVCGPKTFTSGLFTFSLFDSVSDFKKQISDPLKAKGILPVLHIYSFYLGFDATELLSNPKWQQQLEYREQFVLSEQVSATTTSIMVTGDKTSLTNDAVFWNDHTHYMLIDQEIIKFSMESGGAFTCQRGQCGTTAIPHKRGAIVRLIGGKYDGIAPQIGSELYYEIAYRVAKTYNEGGFDGIYFDAFDGLETHLKNADIKDYYWYYGASFVQEVLRNCKGIPLVEYSWQFPTVWPARGRCGSWDSPRRGYRRYIDEHLAYNMNHMKNFFVTTFGWYDFYPMLQSEPGNYSVKYMFSDDVDYLGVKAVAYDQTMVYEGLREQNVDKIPALRRNLELYSKYTKLRRDNYFSDKEKEYLKKGKYEYKLVKKNSRWRFREVLYSRDKLRDIRANHLSDTNPFKRQRPFIRLENMFSSDGNGAIPLMTFDETKDFIGQNLEKKYTEPIDLNNYLGIRVRVKGNGKESKDAICVRLSSLSPNTGVGDFIVRLNFEGWRDVLLTNLDNAEAPDLKFEGKDDGLYPINRNYVNFSRVRSVRVFHSGECKGTRIKQIDAVPLKSNSLINPVVSVDGSSIQFLGDIQSGEYIELYPGEKNAMVYDRIGNGRSISIRRDGRLLIPSGPFKATVSGRAEYDDMPSNVTLTIGLYGQFIRF